MPIEQIAKMSSDQIMRNPELTRLVMRAILSNSHLTWQDYAMWALVFIVVFIVSVNIAVYAAKSVVYIAILIMLSVFAYSSVSLLFSLFF